MASNGRGRNRSTRRLQGSDSGEWQDWLVDAASAGDPPCRRRGSGGSSRGPGSASRGAQHASAASSRRAGSPTSAITLEELAEEFGVSRERQIEARSRRQKAVKTRLLQSSHCHCAREQRDPAVESGGPGGGHA